MNEIRSTDKTTPTPSMECHLENTPGHNGSFTVGDLLQLNCDSDALSLDSSKLKFVTKKPYHLQLLKAETSPDGRLHLLATSYQVGAFDSTDLVLTDGGKQISVHGIQFNIESVIDRSNPPKQPYGPYGGYTLSLPMSYFIGVSASIIFVILLVMVKGIRRWQQRRLIDGLKKHDSRLGPQSQLHVRFRQLERQRFLEGGDLKKYLAEVEDILRLFVIRQFKIPAYDWSDRVILKNFQQRFAFLGSESAKELMVLLRETRKVQGLEKPQVTDIEQLVRKIKRWADQVDRSTRTIGGGRGLSL